MDFTFGLSQFGPEYALMGLMVTAIVFLFRKLLEAKAEQLQQAKEENKRNEYVRQILQRSTTNMLTVIQSHTPKNNTDTRSK